MSDTSNSSYTAQSGREGDGLKIYGMNKKERRRRNTCAQINEVYRVEEKRKDNDRAVAEKQNETSKSE